MPLRQGGVEQPVEQHQRQIVDHFPAHVLQRLERGGLARARQAGNEQYGLRRFETHDGLALFRPMFLTASSTLIGADASNGARRTPGMSTPAFDRCTVCGGMPSTPSPRSPATATGALPARPEERRA